MAGDERRDARPRIRTIRSRRLIGATLVVLGIELVLSIVSYGWDMSSGFTADEWETDEWLAAVASVWIIPMVVMVVLTYRLYRHASGEADEMRREIEVRRRAEEHRAVRAQQQYDEVRAIIDGHQITPFFQPIVRLEDTSDTVGFEALSRFPTGNPQSWFTTAAEVRLTEDLELEALRRALDAARGLPEEHYLSLNVSPITLENDEFFALFRDVDAERIVVEITENLVVDDYERTGRVLRSLRKLGARLAVDDAGAGFASLRHIVNLEPDFIKLDRSLISRVDRDPARRAMAKAITLFAADVGAVLVAEGVEEPEEMAVLRELGVSCAQGYLFGRPAPVEHWTSATSQP